MLHMEYTFKITNYVMKAAVACCISGIACYSSSWKTTRSSVVPTSVCRMPGPLVMSNILRSLNLKSCAVSWECPINMSRLYFTTDVLYIVKRIHNVHCNHMDKPHGASRHDKPYTASSQRHNHIQHQPNNKPLTASYYNKPHTSSSQQ
jgi:hypothetical protein